MSKCEDCPHKDQCHLRLVANILGLEIDKKEVIDAKDLVI